MYDMNRQKQLADAMPEVPEVFHNAVCRSLEKIIAEEQQYPQTTYHTSFFKRRTFAFVLAAVLLLSTFAYAAYHFQIFDALGILTGNNPKNAALVMQHDLAKTTVNGVDITVREAGYDGKTLFVQYSYRMTDVTETLGTRNQDGTFMDGWVEEDMQLLLDRNVGWWIDQLWIDGKSVDMSVNSGAYTTGSDIPGEIVQTEYWRLDNEDITLSGKVEVSLPIGERQPLSDYSLKDHPEKRNENGDLLLPEKGMVTFTLDTSDMLSQVRYEHPNVPVKGENVTAQVSEVCYSPLLTYITLDLEGDPDAIAAYKAENGEGLYSEDGETFLWEYGGLDVFGAWVSSLMLVDESGQILFPDQSGYNGCGHEWAEFVYPYIENTADTLYLAPIEEGVAVMEQAIKVR